MIDSWYATQHAANQHGSEWQSLREGVSKILLALSELPLATDRTLAGKWIAWMGKSQWLTPLFIVPKPGSLGF